MKAHGLLITAAVFAALLAIGFSAINRINDTSREAEWALVQNSVRSAALTCYAVEGVYPAKLEYLKENYGLVYDESRYNVTYDCFASNVFPDIYVMEGDGVR